MKDKNPELMEKVISLAKGRGFIYPGSLVYGGLAGSFDYGPMGVLLKENLKKVWLQMFRDERDDMYGLDAAIIMNPKVWEASGHVAGFADPLESGEKFNVMFQTSVGAGESAVTSYLRPETAQGIFVNFKNIIDSHHPKLPFGIAQIGKAFRNEISPRDFIFRQREFEQMEVEYFIREKDWEKSFEEWRNKMKDFAKAVGIEEVYELEVGDGDRAHYSKRTIDFEFDYPFGRKELWGLAYRTDFDLSAHSASSTVDLSYFDEETGERFVPHVIEPSLGVDRTILAILLSAYREDDLGGESRMYLKLPKEIAPLKAAVFPLLKNKPELVKKAKEIRAKLQKEFNQWIAWDDNGNIGKRYRRQDEIGTPYCITIDFDTLGENPELLDTVTVRDRDTGEQKRVKIEDLKEAIK
ncbi:MAG: glycine--tRNA ligase [Parcubacteria bacterium C7867-005]|nr:MAG: glycine--tRNA ligase [Parcubacteria bacterium C7867-005]